VQLHEFLYSRELGETATKGRFLQYKSMTTTRALRMTSCSLIPMPVSCRFLSVS